MRVVLISLFVTLIHGEGSQGANIQSNYYHPPQQHPVNTQSNIFYAKIYPLSNDGHQNRKPFTGYLLPLQGAYQGYYHLLCSRDPSGEINFLRNQLILLNHKIKILTEDYNRLDDEKSSKESNRGVSDSDIFLKQPAKPGDEVKQQKEDEIKQQVSSSKPEVINQQIISDKSLVMQQTNNGNSIQQIGSENVNTNNNVFQCEGVTCPKDTVECKIVERSDEPKHEMITTTIYCLDKDQNTLKEENNTRPNPQKGSSVSNSRTVGGGTNDGVFQQMSDEFSEKFGAIQSQNSQSMGDMQNQMNSIFSSGFFANNPFMQNMTFG